MYNLLLLSAARPRTVGVSLPAVLYPNDSLWDGQQCLGLEGPCCTSPNLPWFYKPLGNVSNNDIEVRSCVRYGVSNEDIPFDIMELYVK